MARLHSELQAVGHPRSADELEAPPANPCCDKQPCGSAVCIGPGHIVTLCHLSSTSYQIH
jgi:hypothetical protein